jgi:hypothetical protein
MKHIINLAQQNDRSHVSIFLFLRISQEKEDGPLYKFYEVIMDYGGEFMQTINNLKGPVTLFAPSNEAWSHPTLNNIIRYLCLSLDHELCKQKLFSAFLCFILSANE